MTEYYLAYVNQDEQKENGRITEQLIEQELLEYVENLRSTGVEKIEKIKDDANDYIESVKNETNAYITDKKNNETDGVVKTGRDINGDIHFEDGDDVDYVITNASNKGGLGENYIETKQIYQDVLDIAPNTEKEIEENIRQYIDDNYEIVFENDGLGNVNASLNEKVI